MDGAEIYLLLPMPNLQGPITIRILLVGNIWWRWCIVTEPFTYSIEPFTKTTDKSISMSVTVSSVSKVTCLVAPENMTAESLLYEETASTRFYVRTKRLTNIEFSVNYVLKSNQRLFCKITGLLYDPPHVEYYQSSPFRVFCKRICTHTLTYRLRYRAYYKEAGGRLVFVDLSSS